MLIEFALHNFLSFKNEITFSMLAANTVKEREESSDGSSNIISVKETGHKFLRVATIYGANGSGKSNLIKAMSFFKNMILNSVVNDKILFLFEENQYRFDTESSKEPTGFEIIFALNKVKYRYGFDIFEEKVDSEWLFMQEYGNQKESYCFKRENGRITVNHKTFKATKQVINMTRENALFLSTAAQFNEPTALLIKNWIGNRFNILSGISNNTLNYTALQYMRNETMRERILGLIKIVDLGIQDIFVKENYLDRLCDSGGIPYGTILKNHNIELDNETINPYGNVTHNLTLYGYHNKYDNDNVVDSVALPFQDESLGTMKLFALLGPWFDTLANGGILIIDEFGASIHTKLALELIKLFQSRLNNGDAQLILATHDTNLLRKDLLRRDQIWFTEKDKHGISDLYSLVEYKINQATSVRNDATFSKDYLLGKYGAIPYFGDIDRFIVDFSIDE